FRNVCSLYTLLLIILDINDNAPYFRRDTINLDVSESTSAGERFSLSNAVDPDIGSNSIRTYYLSESDNFDIEVQTGRDGSKIADLILKKPLDREENAVHNLMLTAVDGGKPSRSGTASIIVRVLDTNDNAPKFDKESYTINVSENSPIGNLVVKLNATDLDEGSNSEINYSFSLVKEIINYEDFKIYDMEILATDKGVNFLSGKCKITILITDMNDNHPEISIKSFTSPVKEDIDVGTVIAVVSVSDKDSEENGQIDVHVSEKLPFTLRKSSDNYYELVVSEPLDREKVPEYDITFTVTDRGTPPLSDNETMTLELLDVNDNVPQFPQSFYTIQVKENNAPGELMSSITAHDPDLHENQYLVYFIIEKEIVNTSMSMLFSINPENGNLYRKMRLDVASNRKYLDVKKDTGEMYIVERIDRESLCTSKSVTTCVLKLDVTIENPLRLFNVELEIMDINDNAPHFRRDTMHLDISEGTTVGERFSLTNAVDPDTGSNSVKTYYLSESDNFSIEIQTGRDGSKFADLILKKALDREEQAIHNLILTAVDGGVPVRSGTASIIVLDINDNPPHFRRDTIHLDISESTSVGERFSLNNAVDPDFGSNSIKTYYLSESEHFSIEIQTGRDGSKFTDLILKKALDREEHAVHNLILTAVDGGVPARSGTASIIVRVLDTNDNAPQFDKDSYTINLMENSPIGSLVIKLNATDKDEGSNSEILYSFSLYTSEKTQSTFGLNPENGEIRVKEMINYEDFKIYNMEIIATDKGSNSLSGHCKITVVITDMNDNHPEISINVVFTVNICSYHLIFYCICRV
uniref:Si:ch73-233f7.5 n=1 Tax=Astyanax mexicanus TaxID=7994 RepID=A0A8B9GPE8_ASTMX